jgi:hypothetical protein
VSETDESKGAEPDSGHEGEPGAADLEQGPRKRKRRRRRGKKPRDPDVEASQPAREAPAHAGSSSPLSATMASLTSGLFSHLDDREEPCRVDGCDRSWTWTAQEQIQSFGQPPPRRMCAVHQGAFDTVADREVECTNPGCTRTWTLTKAAQIAQAGRGGPAPRMCDECLREEKHLADRQVRCRLDACKRTWTWSAEAQRAHRTWLRRHPDHVEHEPSRDSGEGHRRRRRKPKRRASIHEPPPRLCEPCKTKLGRLEEREGPCKVHGCTRGAVVDREQQLRAWAALGTDDLDVDAPLSRRMCEACREFCRTHPDREVPCGRPGCDHTWTYKTGAQLQAMLAGRHEDPIRLCPECASGDFVRDPALPPGTEAMPCVVMGCDGVWHWRPGLQIAPAALGTLPLDRMCDACRVQRGAEPAPTVSVNEPSPAAEVPEATKKADDDRDRDRDRDAPREGDIEAGRDDAPPP